jgi:hypothetical protein
MVSKRLRFEILKRDGYTCRYCGASAPETPIRVDHVVPEALGGASEPTNLVAACVDCNAGKSSSSLDEQTVDDVSSAALRWRDAIAIATEIQRADRRRRDSMRDGFLTVWDQWGYQDADGERQTVEIPLAWPVTIDRLVAAGLEGDDILDSVEIAMRTRGVRERWPYFCGVAWAIVRARQDLALEYLEGMSDATQ